MGHQTVERVIQVEKRFRFFENDITLLTYISLTRDKDQVLLRDISKKINERDSTPSKASLITEMFISVHKRFNSKIVIQRNVTAH